MSMENGQEEGEGEPGQGQHSNEEYLTPMQVSAEQRLQQGSERLRAQQGSERPRSQQQVSAEQRLQQGSERLRAQQGSERLRSQQQVSGGPRVGGANLPGDIRIGDSAHTRNTSSEVTQNRSNVDRENSRQSNVRPEQLPVQNVPDVERWLAGAGPNQNTSSRGRLRSDVSESELYPDSSSPGSYHSEDMFPHG